MIGPKLVATEIPPKSSVTVPVFVTVSVCVVVVPTGCDPNAKLVAEKATFACPLLSAGADRASIIIQNQQFDCPCFQRVTAIAFAE